MDDRIQKAIHSASFVTANKHTNTKIAGKPASEYCDGAKASYQSVRDLIARRNAIKRAVVCSNAATKVAIAGAEYSVAEAIEMKNHGAEYLKDLLSKMSVDLSRATKEVNDNNGERLERRADEYMKSMYGATDMKNATEEAQAARDAFVKSQSYELVDPLDIRNKMESIDTEISSFLTEVDAALSVSNAVTEITVSY